MLTSNSENSVFNKENATNIGKIKVNSIEWYVPNYTPSIPQQVILSEQILSKVPTDLQYVERSVFKKEVNTQNIWIVHLGTQEGVNSPMCTLVGSQKRYRRDSQSLNNDTSLRPPLTSAQCNIATKNNLIPAS